MAVGFDTPSKRKNESIDNAKNRGGVKELIEKVEQIGSLIVSDNFKNFQPSERAEILKQFAHYSSEAKNSMA